MVEYFNTVFSTLGFTLFLPNHEQGTFENGEKGQMTDAVGIHCDAAKMECSSCWKLRINHLDLYREMLYSAVFHSFAVALVISRIRLI